MTREETTNGHSWAGGEVAVPEEAVVSMAKEGIRFIVEGPATYERLEQRFEKLDIWLTVHPIEVL